LHLGVKLPDVLSESGIGARNRRELPMSSFDKSQTRKKMKRRTKATAKKMTKTTTATRSERALIYFSGEG
jgi:hypothetical protein